MEKPAVKAKIKILPAGKLNKSGFTLIELTVVVFLISLMLLIAIPRVRDTILTDDLKSAVNHISNTARELRSESIRNNIDYTLHIDLNNSRIWTDSTDMTPEGIDVAKKGARQLPGEIKISDIYRFDHEKISDGEVTITFYRKGFVQPTVLHIAEGERSFTLIFHPFLNTVETHDKYIDYRYSG